MKYIIFLFYTISICNANPTCVLSTENITCAHGDCVQNGDMWACECNETLYHGEIM